jgi:predicted nucleic acid-binding protein
LITFVDSNVLIDIVSDDPVHANWSTASLGRAALSSRILVDPIVFAEVSIRFSDCDAATNFFLRSGITVEPTPIAALCQAGRAFLQYRRQGGSRTGVLPDFLIGAHSAHRDAPLLNRDARRFRAYFPTLALIAPDPSEPPTL